MKYSFKLFVFLILSQSILFAQDQIDKSMDVIEKTNNTLKGYQTKINNVDEKTKILLDEYKYTNKELQNTIKYNKQLSELINSQEEEMRSINNQLIEIEQTHKNIYPLMSEMILSLKKLIEADTPFLIQERTNRVQKLQNSINRADIKTAEKFRIILESFKIEYDYANTIETYESNILDKTYNILRVGRVGLYYQSLDLKNYGYWNNTTKEWIKIENTTAQSNIRKAIKIANKQQNVELLELPFLTYKEN